MSDDLIIAPDDGNLTAAEYVLRLLSENERRQVELRLAREPALADDVAFWEARLAGLADAVVPVTAPSNLWLRIEAALRASRAQQRAGLWDNVMFWRWSAIGSFAVAACALAAVFVMSTVLAPRSPMVATLGTGGRTGFVAAIDPRRGSVTILPAALTNADQHSLQLWLIAPGDQPHSLGLVDPGYTTRINIPAQLTGRLAVDATMAISVEPVGGSPTGLPTGPVIASGKLVGL